MIWIVEIGLAVILLLVAERSQRSWRRLAKMVASTGFIVLALSEGAFESSYGRLVVVALVCAWFGDLLLTFVSRRAFLGGLVVFLLGHVAYVTAFGVRGVDVRGAAVAAGGVVLVASIVWRWLRPHLDREMIGPVAGYVVVISAMVAAAIGTHAFLSEWRIVVGAVAFFLSDLFVARERFVHSGFANRAWGLPLYYSGQVLLALSVGGIV